MFKKVGGESTDRNCTFGTGWRTGSIKCRSRAARAQRRHTETRCGDPGKNPPSDDYAADFALCGDDPVFEPAAEFLRQLWMRHHRVEIWTGRPEHTRAVTDRGSVRRVKGR